MKGERVHMLPGNINPHMALQGVALLRENEEEIDELVTRVGIRQHLRYAVGSIFHLFRADRSEISQHLVTLSNANLALEARVLELEQRLEKLTATTP